jgi:tellurite resistance protein
MRNRTPLWRQTPPAIFPVTLGFMALALGWHNASDVMPVIPVELGDLMLAVAMGFYLWFLLFYVVKAIARPSVVLEDLKMPPARGGIAAMAMAMMLLAAALLPFGVSAPQVWWTGVLMMLAASALVLYSILTDPPEKRQYSTFQYLSFVGPIVGPMAGIPLGYVQESILMAYGASAAWGVVTVGLFLTLNPLKMPVPLRPSLMIFAAPISLLAMVFGALGNDTLFGYMYPVTSAISIALMLLIPWMAKGGFSPLWGAFTFPVAAFLNVQVMAVGKGFGMIAQVGVYAGLVIGTPLILFITYRMIMLWVTGDLAKKTGAATA